MDSHVDSVVICSTKKGILVYVCLWIHDLSRLLGSKL